MDPQREKLYQDLEKKIGNTLLVKYNGSVPNWNKIWLKRECDNPFGSHYDRVYLALFRYFEEREKIKPGSNVLETTSGTAGISFAGIGKILGFNCYVALPDGGEKAREEAIKKELVSEDRLILTSSEKYVNGFPSEVNKFLIRKMMEGEDFTYLNSSMGHKDRNGLAANNEITLTALGNIAKEAAEKAYMDYFIPAIKSGSSLLGVGRVINARIIGFEPFQYAYTYDRIYPKQYSSKFGIKPEELHRQNIGLCYGTGFPHIRNAVNLGLVNDIVLVSDKQTDEEYFRITGRRDTERLPHWDAVKYGDVGKTTLAGIAAALDIAEKVKNKNILVIAYDKAERYDSLLL